jgi:hypothetical protein
LWGCFCFCFLTHPTPNIKTSVKTMGNSKSKGKTKSKSSSGGVDASEFASHLPVSRLLNGDDAVKRRFRLWCKQQNEEERLAQAVEFVEAVEKRAQVYKSGRRCGDSEEVATEHLHNNGLVCVSCVHLACCESVWVCGVHVCVCVCLSVAVRHGCCHTLVSLRHCECACFDALCARSLRHPLPLHSRTPLMRTPLMRTHSRSHAHSLTHSLAYSLARSLSLSLSLSLLRLVGHRG